jgi:hypothetical protein
MFGKMTNVFEIKYNLNRNTAKIVKTELRAAIRFVTAVAVIF